MTNLRRLVRVAVVPLMLALTLTVPAQAANAGGRAQRFQNEMLRLVNQTRAAHDLVVVHLNRRLSREAWRHSIAMGRRFVLFHTSNLWDLVRPYDAMTWGENIAYADTLRRVEQLWMQSYHHRVNLLNPSFRSAGIGVVRIEGWLWVTLQLYG
ncbi:MAG: CAP domain-containing protein [Actinomycetota bacterium]